MSASRPFPRVLLLSSEAPHSGAAGAIVLQRLLRDFPVDRLLVVTSHLPPDGALRLDCRYEHLPLAADRLNNTRFWPWRPGLRSLGASALVGLGRVDRLLEGFAPEVVVTLMQDSWFYDLAAHYAGARQLPLVLLAHDVAHGFEPVPEWLQQRQLQRDAAVYRQAKARLCISPGMSKYHEEIFSVAGEVLLPPRSDDAVSQAPEACRNLKQPGRLTLGYAGGLHYGYGEQLLRLLPVLRETGTRVELYSPRPAGILSPLTEATDVLHFNGYAATPEEAWRGLLRTCDAVIQPYLDPPGPHALQYRTHFPSKLGDCLALGLPLLITGPADASGVDWCRQRPEIALWAGDQGGTPLRDALYRLRTDDGLRVTLAANAQAASVEFSPAVLRRQFMDALMRSMPEQVNGGGRA